MPVNHEPAMCNNLEPETTMTIEEKPCSLTRGGASNSVNEFCGTDFWNRFHCNDGSKGVGAFLPPLSSFVSWIPSSENKGCISDQRIA